ncbi:hypothetical protein HMSSN036_00840 [Paenibacillus macerans]|nr:hypothetical protein HMSSN036_00840 [Paenibacillus macerans]
MLRADPDDLELGWERVYVRADPSLNVRVEEICYGYRYPNGNSIGGQIIGRGNYIQRRMNLTDPKTGEGTPGPEWNVGPKPWKLSLTPGIIPTGCLKRFPSTTRARC